MGDCSPAGGAAAPCIENGLGASAAGGVVVKGDAAPKGL